MTAEEVARLVAATLSEHGYPYFAVTANFDPPYPTVTLWDDHQEIVKVIACTARRYDLAAKDFADTLAATMEVDGRAPTGARGYAAWPHSSVPDAVSIAEWIVLDKKELTE